jgi:cobalt-zinc-cadmium efflux system outer membrane protein
MQCLSARARWLAGLSWVLTLWGGAAAHAQAPKLGRSADPGRQLDSLMALARRESPAVLAAEARLRAARANVGPAGAFADPMLMAGIVNLPLGSPGFRDEMAMKMIGVEQTLPFPGKRSLRRTVAGHEVDLAEAELEQVRREAARDAAGAYLELALADTLERLSQRQHVLLLTVARTAQASYAAGRGGQEEPLRIQTELVRLSGEVTALHAERVRALAHLNALLGQDASLLIEVGGYPRRLQNAVATGGTTAARFVDTTLGSPAAASPLPAANTLRRTVVDSSPMILAHLAELGAQDARADLTAREASPDPTLSLQYGQRNGLTDMVSAGVRFPIPLWGARQQRRRARAERATFEALEHEHHRMAAELEAEVVDLAQTAELHRTRLALYQTGVLPRARAAAEAALAGYRTGRTTFQGVLDTYTALYRDEADAVRLLTEFSKAVIALEALAGREVVS